MPRVSAFTRVVFEDGGLSALATSLLLMAVGLGLISMSATDARAAFEGPRSMECAHWLGHPLEARWVTLRGCRLDLASAASRNWRGVGATPVDGGVAPRTLELFIPVSATAEREVPPRAVVATTEAGLLGLVDDLARQPAEQVDTFIDAHRDELASKLEPAELTGYVEPVASLASRKALNLITREGAVVLEQNRAPRRANAIFGVFLGMVLLAVGFGPLVRRTLLLRELWQQERDEG